MPKRRVRLSSRLDQFHSKPKDYPSIPSTASQEHLLYHRRVAIPSQALAWAIMSSGIVGRKEC